MSIRKVSFAQGEFYHIYNRGNSKQIIFKNPADYSRFVELLFIANTSENFNLYDLKRFVNRDIFNFIKKDSLVAIGTYCLMPNHFHLLLTPLVENGVSKFMQKLTTAYSMYFNKKYTRTGGLFEGKFKSEHCSTDRYLKYIYSYIHLNPVKLVDKDWKKIGISDKKKVCEFLDNYKWSSYSDFRLLDRKEKLILQTQKFPEYFLDEKSFDREIFEWLSYND